MFREKLESVEEQKIVIEEVLESKSFTVVGLPPQHCWRGMMREKSSSGSECLSLKEEQVCKFECMGS